MKQNRRITKPHLHLVTSGTFRWVTTLIRIQEKYIISGWIWVMVRLLVHWVHFHFSVTYMNAHKLYTVTKLQIVWPPSLCWPSDFMYVFCHHSHTCKHLAIIFQIFFHYFYLSVNVFKWFKMRPFLEVFKPMWMWMWKNHKKTTQARTVDIPALLLCESGHHFTEFLWESTFSWLKISLAKDLIPFDKCAPLKFSKLKIEFLVLF